MRKKDGVEEKERGGGEQKDEVKREDEKEKDTRGEKNDDDGDDAMSRMRNRRRKRSRKRRQKRGRKYTSPQQGNLRLLGPPSGQDASDKARTRDRNVPADLRAVSLFTVPPMPQTRQEIAGKTQVVNVMYRLMTLLRF
ncbi:hypothetical protein PoB_000294800 [Plakobranchus ocellatus]|uniref:Uncharacterized protein n=1 Tax=Plakobranchus ocellatus TaxID=259542 RepID=A0AAV3Y1B7_9GAST|nr:hypothetical protein PoB_000294800 [Plakobranchus ocellatus]